MTDLPPLFSIADVVARATDTGDPWRLALVQRHRVWDELRAAKLLDSILAGFPIGSLLLVRTAEDGWALEGNAAAGQRSGARRAVRADRSWSLLDGQQRCWALSAVFTGRFDAPTGEGREFFLHLSEARTDLDSGRRDKALRRWITWRVRHEDGLESADRSQWVSVGRLGEWLAKQDDAATRLETDVSTALAEIDPETAPQDKDVAKRRLLRLADAWDRAFIPLQTVELQSSVDVLELFRRVNMEGVATSAADLFFAGVKTEWADAEKHLDRITTLCPFLSQVDALRMLARLSTRTLTGADVIPLNIRRLRGTAGQELVGEMRRRSEDAGFLNQIEGLSQHLRTKSGLGAALWHVDRTLFDVALGWAAEAAAMPTSEECQDLATFLFWGTALRIGAVLRYGFHRQAMTVAFKKDRGSSPTTALFGAARSFRDDLAYGKTAVRRPFVGEEVSWDVACNVVDDRWRLFLCVAQEIPFDHRSGEAGYPIDWDHLFPQNARHRLKWKGPNNDVWAHYHPQASALGRGGNFAAMHASTNRALQDDLPKVKFKKLRKLQAGGELLPANLQVNAAEEKRYLALGRELDKSRGDKRRVDHAVKHLVAVVAMRERRIFELALDRFPLPSEVRRLLEPKAPSP